MRLPRLPALAAAVLCAWAATSVGTDGVEGAAGEKPPHILTIIVDDMGFADTMIHNPTSFMTPEFGRLARTGITLLRHHTYLCARRSIHPACRLRFTRLCAGCSPTRRSFLTGRFPVHLTGSQPPVCSNFMPLQFSTIPQKLKQANYVRAPKPPPPTSPPPISPRPHRVLPTPCRRFRRRTSSARATSASSPTPTSRSTVASYAHHFCFVGGALADSFSHPPLSLTAGHARGLLVRLAGLSPRRAAHPVHTE